MQNKNLWFTAENRLILFVGKTEVLPVHVSEAEKVIQAVHEADEKINPLRDIIDDAQEAKVLAKTQAIESKLSNPALPESLRQEYRNLLQGGHNIFGPMKNSENLPTAERLTSMWNLFRSQIYKFLDKHKAGLSLFDNISKKQAEMNAPHSLELKANEYDEKWINPIQEKIDLAFMEKLTDNDKLMSKHGSLNSQTMNRILVQLSFGMAKMFTTDLLRAGSDLRTILAKNLKVNYDPSTGTLNFAQGLTMNQKLGLVGHEVMRVAVVVPLAVSASLKLANRFAKTAEANIAKDILGGLVLKEDLSVGAGIVFNENLPIAMSQLSAKIPLRLVSTGKPSAPTEVQITDPIGTAWKKRSAVQTEKEFIELGGGKNQYALKTANDEIILNMEAIIRDGKNLRDVLAHEWAHQAVTRLQPAELMRLIGTFKKQGLLTEESLLRFGIRRESGMTDENLVSEVLAKMFESRGQPIDQRVLQALSDAGIDARQMTSSQAIKSVRKSGPRNILGEKKAAMSIEPIGATIKPKMLNFNDILYATDSNGVHIFKVIKKNGQTGNSLMQCIQSPVPSFKGNKFWLPSEVGEGTALKFAPGETAIGTNPLIKLIVKTKALNPKLLDVGNCMQLIDKQGGHLLFEITQKGVGNGSTYVEAYCVSASEKYPHLLGQKIIFRRSPPKILKSGETFQIGVGQVSDFEISEVGFSQSVPRERFFVGDFVKAKDMTIGSGHDLETFKVLIDNITAPKLKQFETAIAEEMRALKSDLSKFKKSPESRKRYRELEAKGSAVDSELAARKTGASKEPVFERPVKAKFEPKDIEKMSLVERRENFQAFWKELGGYKGMRQLVEQVQALFLGVKPAFFAPSGEAGIEFANLLVKNKNLFVKYGLDCKISSETLTLNKSGRKVKSIFVYNKKLVEQVIKKPENAQFFPGFYERGESVDQIMQSIADAKLSGSDVGRGLTLGFPLDATLAFEASRGVSIGGKLPVRTPGISYAGTGGKLTHEDLAIIKQYKDAFVKSGMDKVNL